MIQYTFAAYALNYSTDKRILLIYSLKNTKNPIVKFENFEFHIIDFSFFVEVNENKTVFVLFSS